MQIPYDTGKVKIGMHYTPPVRYDSDPDMERLQRSLIRSPKRQVQAHRRYQLTFLTEAVLWTLSAAAIVAIPYTPAIWRFITSTQPT